MKSVKEKAKKHAEFLSDSLKMESPLYRARMYSFEAGANYVLDHLSKTIAVSRDGYLRDNLKKMIEQLNK